MTATSPNPKQIVAERLAGADLSTERFIDVENGSKRSVDHTRRPPGQVTGNYGVYPGDGLVDVDIDDYGAGTDDDGLDAILNLPETLTVESPHTDGNPGGHRYYRVTGDVVDALEATFGTANPQPSWGEVRAHNQYVVGPGSQLDGCDKEWCDECEDPDGGWYEIATDAPIATITAADLVDALQQDPDLNATPDGGVKAVDPPPTAGDAHTAAATDYDPAGTAFEDVVVEETTLATYLATGAKAAGFEAADGGGDRSRADYFACCTAIEYGVPEADAREALADCPHSKVDAADAARDYWRRTWSKALAEDDVEPNSKVPATDPADGEAHLQLGPGAVKAAAGLGPDDDVADLTDREKAACVWDLIARTDEFHVRVRRDNGSLWAYDGGVWKAEGERALRHAGRRALGSMNYGQNVLTELKTQARGDPSVEVSADDFGVRPGAVAVENGLLDLSAAADGAGAGALRDLQPDDYALAQLPVEYDPGAGYDEWAGYVDEWAEDGRADALQEYVGYCLHVGSMPIHRALLLVGSGANGKGTFLSVVRALLGEENTTSIELQTLANEKDAVADFYGSLANIDDDLSARKLGSGLGMFKKLVAGDRVRARRLYESGFEFDAIGKHLYAANEVPKVDVPDEDEAFWRRWLLVEFPNHYPPNDRDPRLSNRLTTPESLSGVLNWAIEGWERLLDRGHFTNEEHFAHAKRERWQAWGDSVDQFISECVERDPDAPRLTTREAHRRYTAWCRERAEEPVGQQAFTNTLKNEDVGYGRHRIGGKSQRGYKALGLSDDVPAPDDTRKGGQTGLT